MQKPCKVRLFQFRFDTSDISDVNVIQVLHKQIVFIFLLLFTLMVIKRTYEELT